MSLISLLIFLRCYKIYLTPVPELTNRATFTCWQLIPTGSDLELTITILGISVFDPDPCRMIRDPGDPADQAGRLEWLALALQGLSVISLFTRDLENFTTMVNT